MREHIRHQRSVLGSLYGLPAVRMPLDIARRAPDPERYLHLVSRQPIVDVCPMHTTINIRFAVEDLFCMVGHIDHHRILIGKPLGDGPEDRVVIAQRIVIFGEDATLLVRQFGALIHRWREILPLLRITGPVIHMRAHEVQDGQAALNLARFERITRLVPLIQRIVGFQQRLVVSVSTAVAGIKLALAEVRIVEEEAAAEVVDGILRLGLELIRQKVHLIASLTEHLGEERLIAPFPLFADSPERQHVLEHKTREIPRSHHIRKDYQTAVCRHCHLSWSRRLVIAIELRVVLVIALADYQHDLWHAEAATVNPYLLAGSLQLHNLIEAERQPIRRHIELRLILFRQFVLHLSDGIIGEKPPDGHLVRPSLGRCIIQQPGYHTAEDHPESRHKGWLHLGQNHPLTPLAEQTTQESPEYMYQSQQQDPVKASNRIQPTFVLMTSQLR